MKVRIGKIKFKNVTRPSVIPRWASQDIPIIPLVVDNVMARRRHVPYWPKCVFKKVCSRFSEAVRNGCRLMSNQTALIATDKRASVDNMAKMFTTLRMANKSVIIVVWRVTHDNTSKLIRLDRNERSMAHLCIEFKDKKVELEGGGVPRQRQLFFKL